MIQMAAAKKGGADLAIIFGSKGGGKPSPGGSKSTDMDDESEEEEGEVPADFEDYIVQAFPDLEGDTARMMALKKAIKACVKADEAEGLEY